MLFSVSPLSPVSHHSAVPGLAPARHGRSHSIGHGRRSAVKRNNIRQAAPPTAHCPASTVCRPESTVYRLPSTVHRPLSTVHRPPSDAHRPASTVCRPESTVYRLPSTVYHPPPTVHRPPSTVRRPLSTFRRPPSTAHRPPPDNPASPQACSSVATPQVCTQTMSELSDHHAPQRDSERTVAVRRPARPEQPQDSTHTRSKMSSHQFITGRQQREPDT